MTHVEISIKLSLLETYTFFVHYIILSIILSWRYFRLLLFFSVHLPTRSLALDNHRLVRHKIFDSKHLYFRWLSLEKTIPHFHGATEPSRRQNKTDRARSSQKFPEMQVLARKNMCTFYTKVHLRLSRFVHKMHFCGLPSHGISRRPFSNRKSKRNNKKPESKSLAGPRRREKLQNAPKKTKIIPKLGK